MIFIIIPVFKRLDHTEQFLQSAQNHLPKSTKFVIVDDSPDQEHVDAFGDQKGITVISGTGNLWWGGSINKGIEYLKSHLNPNKEDIIIFANNDVILDQSTWNKIKPYFNSIPNDLFHPRVFNTDNLEIKSGATLKSWIPVRAHYKIDFQEDLIKVDLITGRFLCMCYNSLLSIGGISKNLPHYQGDWDFSLQAKKKGHNTYMVRNSKCYVDDKTTGIRYEKGIGLKEFYRALFKEIKSPQNLNYIYQFTRNHNGPFKSRIAIIAAFSKFCIKYILHRIKVFV